MAKIHDCMEINYEANDGHLVGIQVFKFVSVKAMIE